MPKGGVPLANAQVRPVSQKTLQDKHLCRNPKADRGNLNRMIGWTDQGPEAEAVSSPGQEPVCADGQRLEHATPGQPVIYYATDKPDSMVLVHEALHAAAHPNFSRQLRNFANEGAAEYFALQIAEDIRTSSSSGYGDNVKAIRQLVAVVGEDALRSAYFSGDFTAANNVLGKCGLEAWGQFLQMYRDTDAEQVLKKGKGDYCSEVRRF